MGYFSFQFSTTGVTKAVLCTIMSRVVHMNDPLLIGKNNL